MARASFRSLAEEAGIALREVIETQLSHAVERLGRAYARETYLEQRHELMSW